MSDFAFHNYPSAGSSSYLGRRPSKFYPLPYLDYTSTAVPRNLTELWDWSEFIYGSTAEIRELFRRKHNYFITNDLKITARDQSKQQLTDSDISKWQRTLKKDLAWLMHASEMMMNYAIYGQDFISVVQPIQRYLQCPHCGTSQLLEYFAERPGSGFKYVKGGFVGICDSQICRQQRRSSTTRFIVNDLKIQDTSKFKIKHWPVRQIVLDYYEWTEETRIFWRIPESYKRAVRQGDIHTLATADLGVLAAIDSNKLFEFNNNRIHHVRENSLSGYQLRGWGIPPTMFLSRQAWTLQLIRKQWQALGIDFVVPMRMISPANTMMTTTHGVQVNPATTINHAEFDQQMRRVHAAHRRDPTRLHAIQTPVQVTLVGGEANQLFPVELYQAAKEDLLDAGGFPVELYKGSLTMQAAAVGIRLFEAQNHGIPVIINSALQFVADRITELAMFDPVEATHERVGLADSIELKMAKLQMASAGQLNQQEALSVLDVDFQENLDRQTREQAMMLEAQQKQQDQMMKAQTGQQEMQQVMQANGQPAAGGGPGGEQGQVDPYAGMLPSTGFVPPTSLEEMEAAAVSLAQTLSGMDDLSRRRELTILRERHSVFHSVVTKALEQVRYQQGVEGRRQMMGMM